MDNSTYEYVDNLMQTYIDLFEEYDNLCDTLELCDENFDRDVIENLEYDIDIVLSSIHKVENKLIKLGLLTLPDGRDLTLVK